MKLTTLILLLAVAVAPGSDVTKQFSVSAAQNPSLMFALYPEVQADAPGAKPYSYLLANDGNEHTGFYGEPAALTFGHLAKVGVGHPEFLTVPFPALFFRFTDEGANRLSDYLRTGGRSGLVLVIDGRAYATLDPNLIRVLVARRIPLKVLIRSALYKDEVLDELFDKLKSVDQRPKR